MTWFPLALICALSLATADALIKRGFPAAPGPDLLVVRFVTTGILLAPLVALQPWPEVPPVFWGWLAVLVPMELAAMLLIGIVYGALLFGERDLIRHLTAGVLMVAGVGLIVGA